MGVQYIHIRMTPDAAFTKTAQATVTLTDASCQA